MEQVYGVSIYVLIHSSSLLYLLVAIKMIVRTGPSVTAWTYQGYISCAQVGHMVVERSIADGFRLGHMV